MTDSDIRDKATDCMGVNPVHVDDGLALDEGEWTAISRFIKAVVAHIPSDRDDPVDVAWLRAKGFLNEDSDNPTYWVWLYSDLNPALTIDCDESEDVRSRTCAAYLGDAEDYDPWPHDIHCRGQVYDICRALCQPLKE